MLKFRIGFRGTAWGLAALLLSGLPPALSADADSRPVSNHWLLEAEDDEARFARLEQQFGGFSEAMRAVGQRYERVYEGLARGNLPLASYHWEKLGEAIRLGYMRRPARQGNADVMFLDGAWKQAAEAFQADDIDAAREAFLAARGACMACHVAERVPFMNDQPLFDRTGSFP